MDIFRIAIAKSIMVFVTFEVTDRRCKVYFRTSDIGEWLGEMLSLHFGEINVGPIVRGLFRSTTRTKTVSFF